MGKENLEIIVQIRIVGTQINTIVNYDRIRTAGEIEDVLTELETIKSELQNMYEIYKPV